MFCFEKLKFHLKKDKTIVGIVHICGRYVLKYTFDFASKVWQNSFVVAKMRPGQEKLCNYIYSDMFMELSDLESERFSFH